MKWRHEHDAVDIVIVGAGAAGSVFAKELSEVGLSVVVLDAGPWRDPQKDFASDELSMQRLAGKILVLLMGLNRLEWGPTIRVGG